MHDIYHPPQQQARQFVLFEVHSLRYRYPDGQAALNSIDLTIYEGDRIALVGHNGAGKTTFVKHLNGLHRPLEGKVLYKGRALEGDVLHRSRLEVGMLFQDPDDQLFCNTLYEDVAFGLLNQGRSHEEVEHRVRECVRKLEIEHLLYKAPHNLSYGQKKRAALAAVLAMDPEVLILDEPTASLDPKQEKLFMKLIQDFPGTLVVISHDLPFLFGICDRAVVLDKGRIHHDYTMKDLVSQRVYLREHGLDFTFRFSCCQDDTSSHSHLEPHSHSHGSHAMSAHAITSGVPGPESDHNGEPPLIHLSDYSYQYPDGTWGIRNTHLHINQGESVAIVGENGAGKSTLARCLLGIAEGKGSYDFAGKAVTRKSRKALWRKIGTVFQDPADQIFCPTCWEEVAFGAKQLGLPRDEVKARVAEALEAVKLTGYEHRISHHLSAGERKRLAIAAVLSMRPEVMVLDEPTANLDPRSEELLMEILGHLKITKIVITHDMPLVLALCERTVVMHQGRIIRDYRSRDFQRDRILLSINGIDYTFKNACHREIMELQNSAEADALGAVTE